MKKITFLVCLFTITEVAASNRPSLIWVENEQDVLWRLEPTLYENLGDFSIIELDQSALTHLENVGIRYEIIDLNSGEEEYWLVGDLQTQGFDILSTFVKILKTHQNVAIIKGDRKIIEERVPGYGFELKKLFRRPLRLPRSPLLGKGGLSNILEDVSADSIESYIRWLEGFGTRFSYTYQCTLAAYGLYNKFQEYGLQVEYFSFPLGLNVVATLPGEDLPDVIYIICGHYDSISDDPYNSAPGADDNASGTSAVIEAARLLKDYLPRATVKFICFAGEEQGLWGSNYYASYADSIGMDIRGVLNFDMIGYCDVVDYFDVNIVTDHNSIPLADLLVEEGQELTSAIPVKDIDPGAYWSDHAPFWWYGYPAVCVIERATNHWNPYYHTTNDTTGTLTIPFATEVVKLGLVGLLRLGGFFPDISFHNYEWIDSGGDGHADPGDTLNLTISLLNSGKDASWVEVKLSTNDPSITMIDSNSNYGEILGDSIKDNYYDPFILWVNETTPVHICTLNVAIMADSIDFSYTIPIMIGIPPVLLVDNDGGDLYETYFTKSLDRIGVLFDLLDPAQGITSPYISDYQALVWLTGNNSSLIDSSCVLVISNYLDSGGNLFITGQDVEGCVDTNFYHDYLHATLVEDSTYPIRIDGAEDDLIGHGLSFLIIGSPGANNQVTPSIISPNGGADSVFNHRSGGCCGVRYEDTYKTVYFSFGFEAISSLHIADTVMIRILKWFGLPVGVEEGGPWQESLETTHFLRTEPNPFREELKIEFLVESPSRLELRIYDTAGRMIRELLHGPKRPGAYRIRWDGRNSLGLRVPQGVYFLHLSNSREDWVKKCILLR